MVQPLDVDIVYWAGTLFVDFPTQDIPVLTDPKEWKDWGNDLIACPLFSDNGAPATNYYTNWNTWAWDLFYSMNNYA